MNIEKLAEESGAEIKDWNYGEDKVTTITFRITETSNPLEAFAKALQSSEPVALPTFNELSKNIDDSRFVGHPKLSALDTNNVKTGARIMYDAIYVWLKKQNTPPNAVPLEKYNKVVEQRNDAIKSLGDLSFDCFAGIGVTQPSVKTYNETFGVLDRLRKEIAEAEGKEG